jgi:hypothetical protein
VQYLQLLTTFCVQMINQTQGDRVYTYLSDNLHEGLLAALPRHMRDADESAKLAAIRLLFNHMYLSWLALASSFSLFSLSRMCT